MTKPLEGIRVVDLSRALAGPYCTALLADMGAEIIKVESLNGGDTARQWPPFDDGNSLYFEAVNRNKRSVCIDFYSAEGHEILDRLIEGADVLVENFTLGTLEKLGLTVEHLAELNPRLVIGSVNGFGLTGPLKNAAGLDQVVQGMAGLMSVTGSEAGDAYRVGVPIVDITSGMICAFGIAAALAGRAAGQPVGRVTTSLLETALNLSVFQGQRALSLGEDAKPQGNNHPTIAPYGTFATATAPLNIAVGNDRQWRDFCILLGVPEAVDDPRYLTGALRSANRDSLKGLVEAVLATKPAAEWTSIISAASIPCGPIFTYTQAFGSEQVRALGLVQQTTRRDGTALPLVRGPLSLDGAASEITSRPPLLGEHTLEVLRELGYSPAAIEALDAAGRVNTRRELV
ncbi:CoA-transferase [Frondihabitans sp. PAMC 28766]|uniref:CaiB/BaiF CoA transferase family protein n=1 Tax=Frondihabitans sp. PAMC 28766 TaxID=1795630 RepID=UPI00078C193B|nr:CaiB/BaiF CoA-transferase family protein [Frondihabitans sp. PAMC 28766]AMM18945.1 CoA-transferase [Frondihabitans sp. PAMC 28766]